MALLFYSTYQSSVHDDKFDEFWIDIVNGGV